MYGYDWDTTRQDSDNIKVNDGVMTYYTNSEGNELESIARNFFSTYDFNLDDEDDFGQFNATIENLETGEDAQFMGDSQGNFEWE